MTVRTPYRIALDAVDAMLSDPDSARAARGFLVELMEGALRLSMTPEWDLEDNCSMTEHVVSTLAPSLTDITRDEVRRAADQFGLELEYLDDPYRGIALGEETPVTADEFNAAHPIGTPVLAFPGMRGGRALLTRTRTPAWRLGGHTDVVAVEGYAGGVALTIALTHIEVTEEAPVTGQQADQQEAELDSWMTRAYEAERRAWRAEKRLAEWLEHWNATARTGAVDEVAAVLDANTRADQAEARIRAVRDVLAHHPYGGPDQEDAIRRALDGDA